MNADETNPYANSVKPEGDGTDSPTYVVATPTSGIIPYKNPKALIAYYLGILSGFPLIGLPLGIAAFILGIQGLRNRKRDPSIQGSVHAWIGIGCGGFFAVVWLLFSILIIVVLVGVSIEQSMP
ncbi:MAG: hypothetical protein SGI77_08040 [Pirellulaceae bacterium]|nr:hypothetical protein [Pirellulaceae bacterium]